jgi:phenylalanyl-tRNA synthetase alpha chain
MTVDPSALRDEALAAIAAAGDAASLDEVRVAYLGRKGQLTTILRQLGQLPPEERSRLGQSANLAKQAVTAAIDERREALDEAVASGPRVDVTLPGRPVRGGGRHILQSTLDEIQDIFFGMGFSVALGPDIEDDYHNFEALNFELGHPARDMHDTFFVDGGHLLRTHTSPVQIREMKAGPPPIRKVFPGRVYRNETLDASHGAEFTQLEILYVDEGVTLRDLKGCLQTFIGALFGDDIAIQLRPSHFPFTEPSAELDMTCIFCRGEGCPICKQSGWIELLGCGMVHPNVLRNVGYDPEAVTGYAAGMGIERVAMLRHQIPDIRYFLENDYRFLSQF